MGAFIVRRLIQAIPVVLFSTFLVFMVIHLIPGDAAAVLAGPNARPEALAAIRHDMGLDQPLLVQYLVWIGHLLQGDLGRSTLSGQPIIIFSLILRWLPPGGRVADGNNIGESIKSLILPATTLALYLAAGLSRFIKFNLLEVFFDDYVRTARAKGLSETAVVYRHALRNALLPVITLLGVQFASLLGGTVIIESVYSWPGVDGLMLDGIANRDYAVVQAGLLLLVVLFIIINLLVDLTYALIDPRIRLG